MEYGSAHVGLDAHLLSLGENYRAAGVSHYIYHLLAHLPDVEPKLRYTAYLGTDSLALPPDAIQQSVSLWQTHRPLARILWEQASAPLAMVRDRVNLWHALVNVQPLLSPRPAIVTIQDLSFAIYPERFRTANRLYNRLFVRLTAHRARHIIVTSHSTKEDIVRCYGVPQEKITVTHLAVGDEFRPISDDAALGEFRRQKGLPDHMILFVGTIEPRKNLTRLVEAFGEFRRKARLPHHLVIGGGRGWMYDRVYAAVQELGLQDAVHFPGFIPQADLAWWYNSADLVAYPSLYEGFGLPPLEAMSCGTPVVTTNISSLPEIVGDAAIKVDPHSVSELADAMIRLASDAGLRAEKREAGLKRAAGFSWDRTARETVRVYRRILDSEGGRNV